MSNRVVDCAMLIDDEIILELNTDEAQLLTYMRLANIRQSFLINLNFKLLEDGLRSHIL